MKIAEIQAFKSLTLKNSMFKNITSTFETYNISDHLLYFLLVTTS